MFSEIETEIGEVRNKMYLLSSLHINYVKKATCKIISRYVNKEFSTLAAVIKSNHNKAKICYSNIEV
jgi:hypothetical protein